MCGEEPPALPIEVVSHTHVHEKLRLLFKPERGDELPREGILSGATCPFNCSKLILLSNWGILHHRHGFVSHDILLVRLTGCNYKLCDFTKYCLSPRGFLHVK